MIQALTGLASAIAGAAIFGFEEASSAEELTRLSTAPVNPASIGEAKRLLVRAADAHVRLRPSTVEQTGRRFVDASTHDAAAWGAALQFVRYKSSITSFSINLPDTTNDPAFRDRYVLNFELDQKNMPKISLLGKVRAEQAAQTSFIGEDRNKGMAWGPAWIVMEGGDVNVDNIRLRNVVFRSTHISYFGAMPMSMQDVYFIKCTFDITRTSRAQRFALALLEPHNRGVTFHLDSVLSSSSSSN